MACSWPIHSGKFIVDLRIAKDFGGRCHLRFDDTDPSKEETEYIESIKADVSWLGFDWGKHLYYASNYFEKLFQYAVLTQIKLEWGDNRTYHTESV